MNNINGYFFEASGSTRVDARLQCTEEMYQLVDQNNKLVRSGSLHDLDISDRIGNVSRKIYWDDQACFESTDNDEIDDLLALISHKGSASSIVHRMESSLKFVAVALVVSVTVGWLFFRYGLPATASYIAERLPVSSAEYISENALVSMDKLFFDESEVSQQEQDKWQARFEEVVARVPNEGFTFKLHFRSMGLPNAMALPGGDLVFTDEFLKLVDDPAEFDAVLLHEIGHVVERHGLTQTIQASTVSIIIALAVGDASGLGELIVSLPVFLMQSSYSRKAEASADEYSFKHLAKMGVDPKHFATIILKLTGEDIDDIEGSEDDDIAGYLSSHPGSRSRARRALELSNEFNGQ